MFRSRFTGGKREGAGFKSKFSKSEWETIVFAPLWAHTLVAAADGEMEEKEHAVVFTEISPAACEDEFAREAFAVFAADPQGVTKAWGKQGLGALDGLQEVARILRAKMPAGAADGLKNAIVLVAVKTAQAAGPTFGDKMSNPERAGIAIVATVLNVPVPTDVWDQLGELQKAAISKIGKVS